MKQTFSFLAYLIFILNIFSAAAETIIPDGSQVSGTWTSAESPYLVNGEAIVPQGSSLTIEAGVEVQFKTGVVNDYLSPLFDLGMLRIDGRLQVQGNSLEKVRFTRQGDTGDWGVLYFSKSADSASFIRYGHIEQSSPVLHLISWMDGSGALSLNHANIRIENCNIKNNRGDGIFCDNASPLVSGCLIASNLGKGINAASNCSPSIISSTIVDNNAEGIACGLNSGMSITSALIWGNESALTSNLTNTVSVSFSLLQGKQFPQGVSSGQGNIFDNNPAFNDTANGDYTLAPNSIAVNNGAPDTSGLGLFTNDINGSPRIVHDRIDMGAIERDGDYLRVTAPNGFESWKSGSTQTIRWQSSVASVQIDYSTDGGQNWLPVSEAAQTTDGYSWLVPEAESEHCLVRISAGDATQITDTSDGFFVISVNTVILSGSPVYGNWTAAVGPYIIKGTAVIPNDSTLHIEAGTLVKFKTGSTHNVNSAEFDLGFLKIDGRIEAAGTTKQPVLFTGLEDEGHWGILYFSPFADNTSRLNHCRIEHASYIDSLDGSLQFSGALSFNSVSPALVNSIISDNQKNGIHISGQSAPSITSSEIINNLQDGILLDGDASRARPVIQHNSISANTRDGIHINGLFETQILNNVLSGNGSSAIYNMSGYYATQVINNQFAGNQTALTIDQSELSLIGNLVDNHNTGVVCLGVMPQIMNNTIVNSSAAAIYCENASPYVTNNVLAGNRLDFDFLSADNSAPLASNNLLERSWLPAQVQQGGFNWLGRDPKFKGSGEHRFALSKGSPAIDKGTNENPLVQLPEFDLSGKPRILDGDGNGSEVVDIGAYEFGELIAGFEAEPLNGAVPLTVQFSDLSFGQVSSRMWSFGDGQNSTDLNPQHIYDQPGSYDVALIITGILGSDSLIRENYITVKKPPSLKAAVPDTTVSEDNGKFLQAVLDSVFYDPDSSHQLSFQVKSDNKNIKASLENDSLFITPADDYFGQGRITLTASDYLGLSVRDTFSVTVASVNDAPYFNSDLPDSIVFFADSLVTFDPLEFVDDIDSPDSSLSFLLETTADSISIAHTDSNSAVILSASPAFSGEEMLYVTVTDDSLAAVSDSIIIRVLKKDPVNLFSGIGLPARFALNQNYPNPFNPQTVISYQLPERSAVELGIYNILGQKLTTLVSAKQAPGYYCVQLDSRNYPLMANGVYFYHLQAGTFRAVKKMILMK